ncbi:hypothetical protein KKH27_04940 [bacterium]|nr:hypothetical protein [bacterium]MBU1984055.1 hypothetical protein [bacterium]
MKSARGDFVRKLGCLRLELKHLDESVRANDVTGMEQRSRAIQDLLIDLVKSQRKLTRGEQAELRPRLAELRQQALLSLEASRRILDDSLEAMMVLVKCAQDAAGYGEKSGGSSFMIDRRA